MENDYAIIIGVNDYTPQNKMGLQTLKGAVNDANDVQKWMLSLSGGNLPCKNVKKIISSTTPLKPLQNEIDDAFLAIETDIIENKDGAARRLYFYFAGHGLGTLDNTKNTALCLANWSEYRRQSALSSEGYKETIKQYGYFEEIIFVADCCRNTKINIKPIAPTFASTKPGEKSGMTKMFVAYATQYQNLSYEIERNSSEMRGAFTSILLEGLNGGAASNGKVGADDLRDFLMQKTPELAQKRGYFQIPDIEHNFTNNAAILSITSIAIQATINFYFSPNKNNLFELLNGNLDVIGIIDASLNKSYSIQLPKGLYVLRDKVTNEITLPILVSKKENKDVNV